MLCQSPEGGIYRVLYSAAVGRDKYMPKFGEMKRGSKEHGAN
jgi:hypothetical protein